MFLLPAPPDGSLPPNFRRSPGPVPHSVSPKERILIRWALYIQSEMAEFQSARDTPTGIPQAGLDDTPEAAAAEARRWLRVSVDEQMGWNSRSDAFQTWRSILEDRGIYVFHFSMGIDGVRGFSASNSRAPIVGVNSAYNFSARIFSLMHEVGHLVTGGDSSCWGFGPATGDLSTGSERWCEAFAAAVLIPEGSLRTAVAQLGLDRVADVAVISDLSARFNVSVRATALRLINLGLALSTIYDAIDAEFDWKSRSQGGPGRDRSQKRIAELGAKTVSSFLGAVGAGRLTGHEASSLLRVHPAELSRLGELVG